MGASLAMQRLHDQTTQWGEDMSASVTARFAQRTNTILQCLCTHDPPCPWPESSTTLAEHNLELEAWLREHSCPELDPELDPELAPELVPELGPEP